MIQNAIPIAVLASVVAMPLVLWLAGRKGYELFGPLHGVWWVGVAVVLVLNMIAPFMYLRFGTEFSQTPIIAWSGLIPVLFFWARTFALVVRKSAA